MGKILIIEDEPELVEMLQDRIAIMGHEVDGAYDGQVGIKKAKETHPDLIILDVMMPQMDGFDVCRNLKADPSTKDIKILMLSAKASDEDQKHGLECGAEGYITKPFDAKDLIDKIESCLSKD